MTAADLMAVAGRLWAPSAARFRGLKLTAPQGGTLKFRIRGTWSGPGPDLEYARPFGMWRRFVPDETEAVLPDGGTVFLRAGPGGNVSMSSVPASSFLRQLGQAAIGRLATDDGLVMSDGDGYGYLDFSGPVLAASGDVTSLLAREGVTDIAEDFALMGLFSGCTAMTSAPNLPADTVSGGCCLGMFKGCTGLVSVPEVLPAASLGDLCYAGMFYGCTSLVSAPGLPATELAADCYNSMFYGCTSLVSAPGLPATELADRCYRSMFSHCSSLGSVTVAEGLEDLHKTDQLANRGATYGWLAKVAASGTFTCGEVLKSALESGTRDGNTVPSGWTVTTG